MADSTPNIANPIYVPENLLKKRKINEKKAIENAQKRAEIRQKKRKNKTVFKRIDQLIRTRRDLEKEGSRLRRQRQIKAASKTQVAKEDALVFVLRYKSAATLHPAVRKSFSQLRLTSLNTGVFVKYDKTTAPLLKVIEPYVTVGEPSLKTVRDLLTKRGYAQIQGKRTPISDNAMVEEVLGEHNIICVEDLIHQIVTVGDQFDLVNKFLCPFRLSSPIRGWRQKKLRAMIDSAEGGKNEIEDINKLVETMN
ncbi:60S ribosomal protein L7 [Spinellus fusiger]|nr:60S ribosomal protein L7 [Spinellus fusiger]